MFSQAFRAKGGLDKLTDSGNTNDMTQAEEDPEVLAARQEAEDRRKQKHNKMELEREKMRQNIREKYDIKKKDENEPVIGRIGGNKKTPEQVAAEHYAAEQAAQNGLVNQLGLGEYHDRAKQALNGAVQVIRNVWPFAR